jgi:hypothetical protein
VLKCKYRQQYRIDWQRKGEGQLWSGIDGLRNSEIPDETNCVQETCEKNQIANDPIQERCDSAQHVDSFSFGWPARCNIGNKAERLPTLPINSPKGRLRPLGKLIFFCYFSDGVISE